MGIATLACGPACNKWLSTTGDHTIIKNAPPYDKRNIKGEYTAACIIPQYSKEALLSQRL